jgi:large subunit ribosomal protein L9
MKVILFKEDRVAEVSDGYARNYLFPNKLAIPATPQAVSQMERRAEANRGKREAEKQQAQELAEKLSSQEVVIAADAGEEGKLFGSVTAADVAAAIFDAQKTEIDRKKINLNEHIKALGEYSATVKLHHEVNALLKLRIVKK